MKTVYKIIPQKLQCQCGNVFFSCYAQAPSGMAIPYITRCDECKAESGFTQLRLPVKRSPKKSATLNNLITLFDLTEFTIQKDGE